MLACCDIGGCQRRLDYLGTGRDHRTRHDSLPRPGTSIAPLADLSRHPARRRRRTNPHSASGNVSAHLSRVHSLEAFGRRPRSPC
jgi:hypothetical protein